MRKQQMKNRIYLSGILIVICSISASAAVGSNWIEQFGIRWTFDKNISTDGAGGTYRYGTYANGDYWVVGPVNITGISPSSYSSSGRMINGSMINPIPGGPQGYDSAASGWTSSLNVADGVSSSNPLRIGVSDYPIKSLVSSRSTSYVPSKNSEPRLQGASILTVVASAPSADAFRPPYCGNKKFAEIRTADINWDTLASLPPVSGTPPLADSERDFERPWIDHGANYPGEVIHPVDNMPWYGRNMARAANTAALQLNLSYSRAQKETLMYRFLQYGIDVSGVIACPQAREIWTGNGGITNGRKMAAVFAAKVFNHPQMIAQHAKSGKYRYEVSGYGPGNLPPDYIHFGNEDDQVFYVTQVDVDATHSSQWHPDTRNDRLIPYGSSDIGMPEWGVRQAADPWYSNNWWPTNYRSVSGCTMPGSALVGQIMNLKSIWNHPAFFDYCDRYITMIEDNAAYQGKGWQWGTNGVDLYESRQFVWNMWHAYRADYGPIWPDTTPPTARQYTLSVSAANGTVTRSPNLTAYDDGQTVTLTAVPNNGYVFAGWSGGASGTANPVTVTMNGNKTVTAAFNQEAVTTCTLTTSAANGSVTRSPNKAAYTAGESVTLTAAADSGYTFAGWSGGVSGTSNPVTLTMDADKTVTAAFTVSQTQTEGQAYYIAPTGSSSNTGTSWSQAWRQLPSTLQRGAIYYVASGSYPAYTFDDSSRTDYITIVKATEQDHGTSTGWQSAFGTGSAVFADLLFSDTGYILFDGRVEDGFRIVSQQTGGHALDVRNSNYVTLNCLDVDANYATLDGSGNATTHTFGACNAATVISCSNLTLSNSKLHNAPDDGIQIHQSQDLLLDNNRIFTLYGDPSGGCQAHSDGIELIGCRRVVIRDNLVYDVRRTSGIIMGDGGTASGFSYDLTLENNIFYVPEAGFVAYAWSVDGLKLYGNIFWDATYGGLAIGTDVSNMEMYNNIFSTINYSHLGGSYDATEHVGDYNLFGESSSQYPRQAHDLFGVNPRFANLSSTKRSVVKEDFRPTSASPCIDAGTIAGSGLDTVGAPRPGGGAYDIGPFEYQTGTVPQTYALSVAAVNGSVTRSPDKAAYSAGETVTLTAVPAAGYTFAGWSGDAAGSAASVVVTMDANKAVTASFKAQAEATTSPLQNVIDSVSSEQTFDGVDDYATLSTQNWSLAGTTVAMWFKADDTTGTRFLLGHTVGAWSNRVQLYLTDGQLGVGMGDTKNLETGIYACQPGQWYYAALAWDGTSYQVFVNDQLVATGAYTGLSQFGTFADIGNTGNPDVRNAEAFSGTVDDVRVFSGVLDSTQVAALYAMGRNGDPASLIGSAPTRKPQTQTFDGVDDYATLSTQNWSLAGTTVAMWFKADDTTGTRFLLGHTVGAWSNRVQLYLTDGQLGVGMGDTKNLETGIYACQPGQWYYAALAWDGTSYQVFVNDQLVATGAYTGLSQFGTFADIGNTGNPDVRNAEAFSGTIDDVCVFNGVLNPTQVATLYEYGRNGGLSGHWRFADYSKTQAVDASGNQFTAALIGTPEWGRNWASEEFIRMTAADQAIEVPTMAITPQAGTIALWVCPTDNTGTQYLFGHVLNDTNRIALMTVNGSLAVSLGSQNPARQDIAALPVNRFAHVALAWNGGEYQVFVDGRRVARGTYTDLSQLRATFDVGNSGDPSLRTLGFRGIIDDVQTYDRALNAEEICRQFCTYEIREDRALAFGVEATDSQGNPLAYTASSLPDGAAFDADTQVFDWTPWYDQAGDHLVRFNADGSTPREINVSVRKAPLQDWYRRFLEQSGQL